jgi:serine/threonine-protein kinase
MSWSLGYGLRRGDILAGKFRVDKVIGRGGMGIVVAAFHLLLEQTMAIKLPHAAAIHNPRVLRHFLGEARAAAKIQSEHVARVFDVDTLDTGMPYLVMEYLQGSDLSTWLAQKGPLPISLAVDFVLQACDALAQAHVQGIVHRDLKPANLFCCSRTNGSWLIKVLDFGISKNLHRPDEDWSLRGTPAETVMGSPHYMSPEQLKSPNSVDLRSDIWSLGVLLFELITGQLPFAGSDVPELSRNVAMQATPRLADFNSEVPHALQVVINRCLRKNREQRFRNVAELATALRAFATSETRGKLESTSERRQMQGFALPNSIRLASIETAVRRIRDWMRASTKRGNHVRWLWTRVVLLAALTALVTVGCFAFLGAIVPPD